MGEIIWQCENIDVFAVASAKDSWLIYKRTKTLFRLASYIDVNEARCNQRLSVSDSCVGAQVLYSYIAS